MHLVIIRSTLPRDVIIVLFTHVLYGGFILAAFPHSYIIKTEAKKMWSGLESAFKGHLLLIGTPPPKFNFCPYIHPPAAWTYPYKQIKPAS
jgi:hypothetical protein